MDTKFSIITRTVGDIRMITKMGVNPIFSTQIFFCAPFVCPRHSFVVPIVHRSHSIATAILNFDFPSEKQAIPISPFHEPH